MPPLNLPLVIFGRPVKPVAGWFMVASAYLAWINATANGLLGDTAAAWVFAGAWACTAAILAWGWIGRSQRAAEAGLVAVFACFLFRFVAVGLERGWDPGNEGHWLSVAWAGLAASSYLLEHLDGDLRGARSRVTGG